MPALAMDQHPRADDLAGVRTAPTNEPELDQDYHHAAIGCIACQSPLLAVMASASATLSCTMRALRAAFAPMIPTGASPLNCLEAWAYMA